MGFRILEFEVGHFALILDLSTLNSKGETTNLMQHQKGLGPKAETEVPKLLLPYRQKICMLCMYVCILLRSLKFTLFKMRNIST